MAPKQRSFRIVTRGENGEIKSREYPSETTVLRMHSQVGIDDCSTDLTLRGLPVFKGLIGPMGDEDGVVRYESPEVFETLTRDWTADLAHTGRRRRRRKRIAPTEETTPR